MLGYVSFSHTPLPHFAPDCLVTSRRKTSPFFAKNLQKMMSKTCHNYMII
nr:MAG TPA: hypothetical protein [Caudoviricetes sp.]